MIWIKNHFKIYQSKNPWTFLWQITLEGFLVAALFSIFISTIDSRGRSDWKDIVDDNVLGILVISGVIFPILETLLLQALPVFLVRLFSRSVLVQIIVGWIPFALLHFFAGLVAGICAGLIRGFYFSFTYVHWRQSSSWQAFWITSLSHIINNVVVLSLFLMINGLLNGY